MAIELEVNGQPYENFTTSNVKFSLDELSGTFNFTAVSSQAQPLPFKGGEACRVIVENQTVLTGWIEIIDVNYASDFHSITVRDRDWETKCAR